MYLEVGKKKGSKHLWVKGWPSAIAYLLLQAKYTDIRQELWNLLPDCHRQSWNKLRVELELSVSDTSGTFVDVTVDMNRFKGLTTSGRIKDFITAMDEYSFPCVKCPAGCFAYVDECQTVSFEHFIAWKFGHSIFDGAAAEFKGARSDWPKVSVHLEQFTVSPAVAVTEKGLSVLMCASHKAGMSREFIHVPRHPVLGDIGSQYPDQSAAAILTPNVIRAGRFGRYTNSYHVISAVGGYSGISSSSIVPELESTVVDMRLGAATFLAATNRSDVYETTHERYLQMREGQYLFDRSMFAYNCHSKPSDEKCKECLGGGTFVRVEDAYAVHEHLQNKNAQENSSSAESSTVAVKPESVVSTVVIHKPDGFGRNPAESCIAEFGENTASASVLILLVRLCPRLQLALLQTTQVPTSSVITNVDNLLKSCAHRRSKFGRICLNDAKQTEKVVQTEL